QSKGQSAGGSAVGAGCVVEPKQSVSEWRHFHRCRPSLLLPSAIRLSFRGHIGLAQRPRAFQGSQDRRSRWPSAAARDGRRGVL
ncbi:unnamed protein product, partial [Polarella glacialis]